MIGGIDIQIRTNAGESSLEVAVRAIRQQWSRAVFENALTGERYDTFGQIPFGEIEELFVYQDQDRADAWDVEGATPALHNTMIHLIPESGMMTIVVDDKVPAMELIVSAIESAFRDEILNILSHREAA